MAPTTLLTNYYGILVLFLVATAYPIYYLFLSPTRHVKGPVWARLTRLWELRDVLRGQSHLTGLHLHQKYGSVVRLAPNRFSFNDPEDVTKIFSIGTKFPKTDYYDAATPPGVEQIFGTRKNELHAEKRRKIANLYSMSTLVAYEPAVDSMNTVLLAKLDQLAAERRSIDLPRLLQYYAFDVIGEMTVEENFGMMRDEKDVDGMIQGIHEAISYQAVVGLLPELHRPLFKLITLLSTDVEGHQLVRFSNNQIRKHRHDGIKGKANAKAEAFLTKLLSLQAAHKIGEDAYHDVVGSNIAAGSDTTAITLSAVLYYLLKNESKMAKLRQEIDNFASDGRLSDPVTFQQAQQMPYLQAVIKEGLRVHPAVGALLPRMVPKGGVTLSNQFFPEGTHVGVNAWSLSYNTSIFGADAAVFRPERWLEPVDKAVAKLRESMNFAFGGGSRVCLGRNISLLEMSKVVPQVVRHYDLKLANPAREWQVDTSWFVRVKYDVVVAGRRSRRS